MNRWLFLLILASFSFSGLPGCGNKNTETFKFYPKGKIVAKVNNIPIGLEDLNQEIEIYNSMVGAGSPELKITTLEKKIDYLKNEMVRRTLLYQSALDRKLDKQQDYIDALERAKLDLLVMELVKQETENAAPTDQEIEEHYDTYKDQFRQPAEFDIREIVLPSEGEAKDVLGQILKGGDFASLAKSRSKSNSAASGGSLGPIVEDKLFKEMADIAFVLPIGKPSGIFKGPQGYYIIMVEARRQGKQMSLDETREDIKRALTFLKQQQRIEEIISKLSGQSKIEIYEKEVK